MSVSLCDMRQEEGKKQVCAGKCREGRVEESECSFHYQQNVKGWRVSRCNGQYPRHRGAGAVGGGPRLLQQAV